VLISIAIGIFAAGLQISIHKGSAVLWLLGSSAWLMAGTLFPVDALPGSVRLLSSLLPLTHCLAGMRLALLQTSSSSGLLCVTLVSPAALGAGNQRPVCGYNF
jgi:ABC-type polysaccharide/polyol phosphate export permease